MVVIRYPEILLVVVCFLSLIYQRWSRRRHKSCLPTNWPVIGMLPGLLQNAHRLHEFLTEIMKESGGTFMFEGPWFANMDMLITGDTANIQHILSKNFSNFPKGPAFNRIFDILGNGIFNVDSEVWETQRKTATSVFNHHRFQTFVVKTIWNKVEKGLIPVFEHASELGTEMNLKELFQHFTFDSACMLVLGHDPASLSIGLPDVAYEKEFNDAEEALLYRHILPEGFWKLQRWLQVGKEKNYSKAWETLDLFIAQCISSKRKELRRRRRSTIQMVEDRDDAFDHDLLTAYMMKNDVSDDSTDKLIRDNMLNFLFAARDTTSAALTWFFWLVATNPSVENKIREEITTKLHPKEDNRLRLCFSNINDQEMKKLVYLHGALCESLRLFPPVPIQHKASVQPDILPSGNKIGANTRIILAFYAMGRMETIWGKDCLEFKPERWITEQGGTKHEPSYKFITFNSRPRSCLGKDMTFIQMKIIAITTIYNYNIQAVDAHAISPCSSIVLHMKDGLKVRVTKRRV
ncbi:unnamed protein product [Camellia sinensis]